MLAFESSGMPGECRYNRQHKRHAVRHARQQSAASEHHASSQGKSARWLRKNPEMMTNDAANSSADGIDSLLQPWQQLAVQLSPLIGESGFCALYSRAVRLASAQYGWLATLPPGKSIDALLSGLLARFAAAERSDAALANEVLLNTFTKLLTGLIGGALTMRILDAAPAGGTAFQPVQEQK